MDKSMKKIVRKRRRKKNEEISKRNYYCGCGKDYLSYPALYTHFKNKHKGKIPAGSILNLKQKNKVNFKLNFSLIFKKK